MLMVEVQADHQEIFAMLLNYKCRLFLASGELLVASFAERHGNVFALNPVFHQERLEAWLKPLRFSS